MQGVTERVNPLLELAPRRRLGTDNDQVVRGRLELLRGEDWQRSANARIES